jgi:hypothetical protein
MKGKNSIQSFGEFKENLNISDISESKNQYTVVSQDLFSYKWGIEGDFEAYDEDDAMYQAKSQAKKYGAKRQMFNVFLANSDELKDFMNTHYFID